MSLPFAFAANGARLNITATDSCALVIQQAFYKRWRSREPGSVLSAFEGVLLQTAIKKGTSRIRLYYYKTDLFIELAISTAVFVFLAVYLIVWYKKSRIWPFSGSNPTRTPAIAELVRMQKGPE